MTDRPVRLTTICHGTAPPGILTRNAGASTGTKAFSEARAEAAEEEEEDLRWRFADGGPGVDDEEEAAAAVPLLSAPSPWSTWGGMRNPRRWPHRVAAYRTRPCRPKTAQATSYPRPLDPPRGGGTGGGTTYMTRPTLRCSLLTISSTQGGRPSVPPVFLDFLPPPPSSFFDFSIVPPSEEDFFPFPPPPPTASCLRRASRKPSSGKRNSAREPSVRTAMPAMPSRGWSCTGPPTARGSGRTRGW
mmetsp:Transcript_8843/g.26504  ORF Transcript_8843/g.26504 Transcript_8843/m.26504 type:complete len:245 (+) Transcript_8843:841-1575(+)